MIVEFGESGSGSAAPIGAKVADFYLNKIHGRPNPPLSPPESVQVGAMTGTGGTRAALNAADSANRN